MAVESDYFEQVVSRRNQTNHTNVHSIYYSDNTRDLVLLIMLAIIILVINGLITVSFILDKKLRQRPANIMICSQACTDLFTGIVCVPIFLIENKTAYTLRMFLSCYMLYLSLFNLLVISVDRYLALARPFVHHKLIDVRLTTKLIVVVWVAPLGVILIPLCWWFEPMEIKERAQKIYVCTIWIMMLFLVVSMTILYIFATKRAKKTIRTRRASYGNRAKAKAALLARKELRVVHLFGLLLFFFVAAYLPILYINFVAIIGLHMYAPPALEVVGLYLLILNSVVNPVLCIMLKKDYLEAIKKIFLFKRRGEDLWSLSSQYGSQYGSRATIHNNSKKMSTDGNKRSSNVNGSYKRNSRESYKEMLSKSTSVDHENLEMARLVENGDCKVVKHSSL